MIQAIEAIKTGKVNWEKVSDSMVKDIYQGLIKTTNNFTNISHEDDVFSLETLAMALEKKFPEAIAMIDKGEEKRLIASFEEVNEFYEKNKREPLPTHGNIVEFQLSSRLKYLREDEDKKIILQPFDRHGLLRATPATILQPVVAKLPTFSPSAQDYGRGVIVTRYVKDAPQEPQKAILLSEQGSYLSTQPADSVFPDRGKMYSVQYSDGTKFHVKDYELAKDTTYVDPVPAAATTNSGQRSKDNITEAIANNHKSKSKAREKAMMVKSAEATHPSELIDTLEESYEKYNKNISVPERDAFLIAHPDHVLNTIFHVQHTPEELVAKGLLMYMFPNTKSLVYRYEYLAGDVAQKMYDCEQVLIAKERDPQGYAHVSESQVSMQIRELQKVVPIQKRVDALSDDERIFIVPHADFCKSYLITEIKNKNVTLYLREPTSLYSTFRNYLYRLSARDFEVNQQDVIGYVENKAPSFSKREKEQYSEEKWKEIIENRKQEAKKEGDRLFTKFLEEELLDTDIQVVNSEWNRKYNGIVECDWSKIPVAFTFSKVFKTGSPLLLTETQRNGLAYSYIKTSALLGYDVGVGKTQTACGTIGMKFDLGLAKRALVVVPDATAKKWSYEIAGGKDKDGKWVYGSLPQFPLFFWGNLNADITFKEIKEYSQADRKQIEEYRKLKDILARILETIKQTDVEAKKFYLEKMHEALKLDVDAMFKNGIQKQIDFHKESKHFDVNYEASALQQAIERVAEEINILIYTLGKIRELPEKCIILLNYTGMVRLGLNENSRFVLRNRLFSILNQGGLEAKEEASLTKKIDQMIGTSSKEARLYIDDLGVDMFVLDEAHNMKKSFTRVQGDIKSIDGAEVKRENTRYQLDSGEPSNQGIHAMAISQYIQEVQEGSNLILTATPFTNNPLEVYSMLALTNYSRLEALGKTSLKDFFDTYIREENQIVINAQGMPEVKPVVVGFNNLPQLRQLIFDIIDYKTGEDAKVLRPEAISLPDVTSDKRYGGADTYLQMNAKQREYMKRIQNYMNGEEDLLELCGDLANSENMCSYTSDYLDKIIKKYDPEKDSEAVRILRGLSFQRLLAISPYLFACNEMACPTYKEYVEESPKLEYVMGCIASVKKWHEDRKEPVSGQVIYMNAGTHYFPLLKQYLVKVVGFKDSEVALVYGEITKSKKEEVKELFLAGEIKVIIGSATIKEGIDLQTRSTVEYIVMPDWNPTDYNQVKGRIWRQGNEFAYVRIVNVLMADTADVFIFQKLQEKTQRLKELLDRNGKKSQLDLDDVNPEEIKENLITDPRVKASLQIKRITKELEGKISKLSYERGRLEALADVNVTFNALWPKVVGIANEFNQKYAVYLKEEDRKADVQAQMEWTAKGKNTPYTSKFNPDNEAYTADVYDVTDVSPDNINKVNNRWKSVLMKTKDGSVMVSLSSYNLDQLIGNFRGIRADFIKGMETLESMGYTLQKLTDAIASYNSQIEGLKQEIQNLEESREQRIKANENDRETYLASLKTIDERVAEFAMLNHYMEHKMKDKIVTLEQELPTKPTLAEEPELEPSIEDFQKALKFYTTLLSLTDDEEEQKEYQVAIKATKLLLELEMAA